MGCGCSSPSARRHRRRRRFRSSQERRSLCRRASVRRLLERLIRIASLSGTPKMATLASSADVDPDVLTLFTASLCQDSDTVKEVAAASGADAEALQAVIALLPVPFLHACNRRWASSISESWEERYCPVCGSWPAFAEVRGIERSRYFRCGRCGGAWHARSLSCPYCAMDDHDALVSLVPEKAGSHAVIEACKRCLGYVKTFTTLQGCPPGDGDARGSCQRRSRCRRARTGVHTPDRQRIFSRRHRDR